MSNDAMPGLLKIGMTTTSPQQRKTELDSASGVPMPFRLEYSHKVRDAQQVERALHTTLAAFRVNRRREFFELDVKTAKTALKGVAKRHSAPRFTAARLFAWGLDAITGITLIGLLLALYDFPLG